MIGLMNVQFAVRAGEIYVLEVNPRASRTIPFVSKAIGVPLAKLAAQVMAGLKLTELGFTEEITPPYKSVKEVVLPFVRFRGIDIILGPEMKSTGEVMGIDEDFGKAFAKSQIAAGSALPVRGTVFLSVKDRDKRAIVPVARELALMGVPVQPLKKIGEGSPNAADLIQTRGLDLVINTPSGERPRKDEVVIRSMAVSRGISCITTIEGAVAAVEGMRVMRDKSLSVTALQDYHVQAKVPGPR